MKTSRRRQALAGSIIALVWIAPATAQNAPWDRDVVTWTAPTQCVDDSPISACAVTGYELSTAPATAGPWTVIAASIAATATSHTLTVSAGPHCYRARANSAGGYSAYSNIACATTVRPVPGAPTLKTIDDPSVAYRLNIGNANQLKVVRVGTVAQNVSCIASMPAMGMYVLKDRRTVRLDPGVPLPLLAFARCG